MHFRTEMGYLNDERSSKNILISFQNVPGSIKMREQDLKDIFAILIMKLDLQEHLPDSSITSFLSTRRKLYPFLFSTDKALEEMQKLELIFDLQKARTVLKYDIDRKMASNLLCRFHDAKLLHCPSDRTRDELKQGLIIQPTPKGVALLVNFLSRTGISMRKWPSIVFSSLNTMDLFFFDRRAASDRILYSNYLLYLLLIKLMGSKPHIWSSRTTPLLVYYPCLTNSGFFMELQLLLAGNNDEIFDGLGEGAEKIPTELHSYFNFGSSAELLDSSSSGSTGSKNLNVGSQAIDEFEFKKTKPQKYQGGLTVSPFYHRYFTNPESDSHTQYYVSNTGVRLFEGKWFQDDNGQKFKINLCVSGKALCQWLCDCTDIMYPKQAGDVAELLIRAKLLHPISQYPSIARPDHFVNDRNAFYSLTEFGLKTVQWKSTKLQLDEVADDFTSLTLNFIMAGSESKVKQTEFVTEKLETFEDIMKDPGMRHLFRKHLENEFCSENLDAYFELKRLECNISSLHKMINAEYGSGQKTMKELVNVANSCLALAYRIYFIYLSSDAPFTLNIGHDSRNAIGKILIASQELPYLQTPVADMHFDFDAMEVSEPLKPSRQNSIQINSAEIIAIPEMAHTRSHVSSKGLESDFILRTPVLTFTDEQTIALSPTEDRLLSLVNTIVRFRPILKDIQNQIYRTLVEDSVPKFLNGKLYFDANKVLHGSYD